MQLGDGGVGLGNSVSHFGDFCTLWEGVSE